MNPRLALLLFISSCTAAPQENQNWPVYGGNQEHQHYSSLSQIDSSNVQLLQPAWAFHSGDADTINASQIQCNPLVIDGVLYGTSPQMKLFALDADSGTLRWTFNPFDSLEGSRQTFFILNNCRGVSYWTDGKTDKRIFYTAGSYLFAIDAVSGRPVSSFGDKGRIDLHAGLDRDVSQLFVTATSPGVIYKDLIILGSRVDEGPAAAPGHIRAFDVRTGKRSWIFHTIPHPGEAGHSSWENPDAYLRIGGANNWSGMSLDERRGLVFVPTGSASFDFYGGRRRGDNLYANTLLALDAATGKRVWHFQYIHHDVWDRDLPTAPALLTVNHQGKAIDAVAQTTKTGWVFLFNRETGEPLFPITETPVPTDTEIQGEQLSATQPIPSLPRPFVRQRFTEDEINTLLPDSLVTDIRNRWKRYRKDHLYAPPSKQGTIVLPGFDGGAEWGGPAVDPETGMLYVNANEMPWVLTMVDRPVKSQQENVKEAGQRLYQQHCMACHGADRKGTGNFPSLDSVAVKYPPGALTALLNSGRRMMPAFQHLSGQDKQAVVAVLLQQKELYARPFPRQAVDSFLQLPYGITGYNKFLAKNGYPAMRPPWGTLTAINLHSGETAWQVPLGEDSAMKARGITSGTENYGGPVVTAGGLVFIAATRDRKIRAFHKRTGKLLWTYDLPAAGFATPSIYSLDGKQYLVIACGGGKLGTRSGDTYLAFTLPEKS